MRGSARIVLAALAVVGLVAAVALGTTSTANGRASSPAASPTGSCRFAGDIKHVIHIQFDNTHFRRDNPNVPSDLEQMPNLLNFIQNNGTLMTDDHTVLISTRRRASCPRSRASTPIGWASPSPTASGTSPRAARVDRGRVRVLDGTAVRPGRSAIPARGSDRSLPGDDQRDGKIAPAPWVPYTRAGCDVGSVATANTVLENTGIDVGDGLRTGLARSDPGRRRRPGVAGTQTFADFVGIGVHCAQGSALCADTNHGRPDLLPGRARVATRASTASSEPSTSTRRSGCRHRSDLDGNAIKDASNHVGFPGFDGMEATVSLSWVAAMQEARHPDHVCLRLGRARWARQRRRHSFRLRPGEAGYDQQLKDYDQAFGKFFARLAADGINKSNTLFVFTVDEGDHFAGDAPSNPGCDGVTTPCTYDRVGEINADLQRMLLTEFGDTTPFAVHSDDAPNVYVTGNPGRTDPAVRQLGRESGALTWLNPYTNVVQDHIIPAMADPVEEATLHMVTADPFRTPTLTLFGILTGSSSRPQAVSCPTPAACATIPPRTQSFAWNHGDIQDEIASTWVGYVGRASRRPGRSEISGRTTRTSDRPCSSSPVSRTTTVGRARSVIAQALRFESGVVTNSGPDQLADGYDQVNASRVVRDRHVDRPTKGARAVGMIRTTTRPRNSIEALGPASETRSPQTTAPRGNRWRPATTDSADLGPVLDDLPANSGWRRRGAPPSTSV